MKPSAVAGMSRSRMAKSIAVVGLSLLLGACGSLPDDILPDRKVDYKKQSAAGQDLELPPDLAGGAIGDSMPVPGASSTGSASYSEYAQQRSMAGGGGYSAAGGSSVLPQSDSVRVMRDGDQRWLEVDAPPNDVWPRVVGFWRQNGILLLEQNPAIGVMKTDWLENRADIKTGFITDLLRKAVDGLYSAATRDQFRVRLEPGDKPGTTDLYLTHRGMEEDFARDAAGNQNQTVWVPRETDPGLEAEMLRRIMLHLGVADAQAASRLARAQSVEQTRSEMVTDRDGGAALLIDDEYAPAWRLVGIALERVGFAVEDRDRSAGVYYVRYDDPNRREEKGFFSKMAFWKDDAPFDGDILYRVRLQEQGRKTRVEVLNDKGEPERSETGTRILTLIQEKIR